MKFPVREPLEQSKAKVGPGVGPHWSQRQLDHPVDLNTLTQLSVESYIIVPIATSPPLGLIMFLGSALVGRTNPILLVVSLLMSNAPLGLAVPIPT